ncbi:MAG: hypothetical protein Q4G35_01645, partial [Propionibacteriaceae bacterium]|nr:hypothetical protein [Propionibacteriaceae bacterium]
MVITALMEFDGPRPTPSWQEPGWHQRSAYLQADIRTRRLAHALNNAKPGADFEARRVATQLAHLTARRLVARGL